MFNEFFSFYLECIANCYTHTTLVLLIVESLGSITQRDINAVVALGCYRHTYSRLNAENGIVQSIETCVYLHKRINPIGNGNLLCLIFYACHGI